MATRKKAVRKDSVDDERRHKPPKYNPAPGRPTTAVTHLLAPNGKTWCGFEQKLVTHKTNDPDGSTCEGCTREWANMQIQNNLKVPRVSRDGHPRDEWDGIRYPELTDAENDEIRDARRAGYATFYPSVPSSQAQSDSTLNGARAFMKAMSPDAGVTEKAAAVTRKSVATRLKDSVDMSIITRTNFTCDGDDADVINDMYMVLVRFLKIGSGDAKLVADGGKVVEAYKRANTR